MKSVNHIKEFLLFWKPSVARKITFYFAVFGLLIFYLTSLAYLVMAKKYLVNSVKRIVHAQISEISGIDKPDEWWNFVDKRNLKLRSLAQTIKNLTCRYRRIFLHGDECMFATLFFGVLNSDSGDLIYVNGGHEPLYVLGENGIKKELPPTGPAVEILEKFEINVQQLQLAPGDLLIGLTDGVTEAHNLSNELFTRARVKKILAKPVLSPSRT